MKKMLLIILTVCMVVTLGMASAQAAGWYTCTVKGTGMGMGNYYVNLTDNSGAFTNMWFTLNPDAPKESLATALTAQSSGMPLLIYLTGTPADYAVIPALYVSNGLSF